MASGGETDTRPLRARLAGSIATIVQLRVHRRQRAGERDGAVSLVLVLRI